jgi:hypothetical protein
MAVKKAKKHTKGTAYVCKVCGLEVIINKPCDCEEHAIACCGQVMVPKRKK